MIEGYHFACAHRDGHAVFDYTAELPAGAFVGVEADSAPLYADLWAGKLAGRPLVLGLGVWLDNLEPAAWRAYCEAKRRALKAAGLLGQVLAVQISEELYTRVKAGAYLAVLDPRGRPWPETADAVRGWLEMAIPVAREVFQRPVAVLETGWSERRDDGYAPVPPSADVVGLDAYVPGWALRMGRSRDAFDWFVARPVRALAVSPAVRGKVLHLVGQAFRADPDDGLWGAMPPPEAVGWTRALARSTPRVVALSWFAWGSMPGIIGARDVPAVRDALLGRA